jgi:hypothetical protein
VGHAALKDNIFWIARVKALFQDEWMIPPPIALLIQAAQFRLGRPKLYLDANGIMISRMKEIREWLNNL